MSSLDNAHAQMETNFFGPIRTIKAVLPTMREQKAGVIINVSSAEFWEPHPVASVYAASKFAIEGEFAPEPGFLLAHVSSQVSLRPCQANCLLSAFASSLRNLVACVRISSTQRM